MIRKLSILIITVFMFSAVTPVWADGVTEELTYYADVITEMGIMELENSTDFMGEELIDREQAVKYVLNLMNVNEYVSSNKVYFNDVSKYSEGYDMISTAVSLGIIKGDGKGTFRPDDNVTGQEAVIMLLRAMNYEVMTLNGANSYDALARKYGLLDGVTYEGGYINRNNFARMLYNTFDMGIAEQIAFGDSAEYSVSKEKSALSFRKLKKAEGVVTASGISSIYYSAKNLPGYGFVTINDYNYTAGATAVEDYLGYNVEIFYEDSEDENPLIHYAFKKNNEEKTYTFERNGYAEEEGILYSVDENGKKTKINVTPEACMIFNGEAVKYNLDYIVNCGNTGEFTLVSNDGSSDAEVIFINSLKNDVIASIDADNGYIYLKNGTCNGKPYIELPIDEESYAVSVKKDGKPAEYTDLTAGNAISYSVSSNGLIVKILASTSVDSGKINAISVEDETIITVGENDYILATDCYTESEPEIAREVFVVINAYGKVVSITGSVLKNYAAVLTTKKGTGFEPETYVRFYIYPGRATDLALAEKVTVNGGEFTENGNIYISHDTILSMLNETKAYKVDDAYKETSLVSYELDNEGKVCDIEFESAPTGDAIADSQRLIMYHKITEKYTTYSGVSIDGIIINGSPVFRIPTVEDKNDSIEAKDCSISNLTRGKNYLNTQNIKMYDVGFNGQAGAVVINEASSGYKSTPTTAMVYLRTVDTVDSDGNSAKKMYFSQGDASRSVFVSGDVMNVDGMVAKDFKDLSFGDLITFEVDNEGYMDKFSVLYSPKDTPGLEGVIQSGGDGVGLNRELVILKGIARYNEGSDIVVEYVISGRAAFELFRGFDKAIVTVVDTGTKSVRYENTGRINFTNFVNGTQGDELIVVSSRNDITEVICYE